MLKLLPRGTFRCVAACIRPLCATLLAFAVTPSGAQYTSDSHTVALYHFDAVDASGAPAATTTPDSGPNLLDGTLVASEVVPPVLVTSPFPGLGNALHFNDTFPDSRSWVELPNDPRLGLVGHAEWTLEFHFHLDDTAYADCNGWVSLIAKEGDYQVLLGRLNAYYFFPMPDACYLVFGYGQLTHDDLPLIQIGAGVISRVPIARASNHVVRISATAAGVVVVNVDGTKDVGLLPPRPTPVHGPVFIGGYDYLNPFIGTIDEIRFSDVVRLDLPAL